MALTVVVRSGDLKSQATITFDAPRIVIGRGEGCEIRLPDPSVSHRHASIRQRGTDYVVIDEGSSNGTFVGPVRLSPQAPRVVRSGDLLNADHDAPLHDAALPDESVGSLLVVDVQETSSTALVVKSQRELFVGDAVELRTDGETPTKVSAR